MAVGLALAVAVTAPLASTGRRRAQPARRAASAAPRGACPPAAPRVLFPQSSPFRRSGPGAVLWGGTAWMGRCATPAGPSGVLIAPILDSDELGPPRALGSAVLASAAAVATTQGQILAAVGLGPVGAGALAPALTEGRADGAFSVPRPLSGAAGAVAGAVGYLGDVALASVTSSSSPRQGSRQSIVLAQQRHFAATPSVRGRYALVAAPVSALDVALDYRSDALLTWAQSGRLRARFVPAIGPPGPIQTLGFSGSSPSLSAVVSDDGRAIVAWVSERPPGAGRPATAHVYLSVSGPGVRFSSAPRLLERFREPPGDSLPLTALQLVRLSTEAVTLAWTGVGSGGHSVVRIAPVGLGGPGPVTVLSDPGSDAALGALGPGPRGDAVVVWTVADPTGPPGRAKIEAQRLTPSFTRPQIGARQTLAGPGPHSHPAAAIDPASDRALVIWTAGDEQSGLGHALLDPVPAVTAAAAAPGT